MARELHKRKHAAVAIGAHSSGDAVSILAAWADTIFVLQPGYMNYVPLEHIGKVVVMDVGPDKWVNPYHPELAALLDQMLKEKGI